MEFLIVGRDNNIENDALLRCFENASFFKNYKTETFESNQFTVLRRSHLNVPHP